MNLGWQSPASYPFFASAMGQNTIGTIVSVMIPGDPERLWGRFQPEIPGDFLYPGLNPEV